MMVVADAVELLNVAVLDIAVAVVAAVAVAVDLRAPGSGTAESVEEAE